MPNHTTAFVSVLVLTATALASPVERHVPAQFATIQAAINASLNGDTIVLAPGNYPEAIRFNGRSITLRGTDPSDPSAVAATVLTENGSTRPIIEVSGGEAVLIRGLTITGAVDGPGGALLIDGVATPGGSATLENARVINNEGLDGAIQVLGDATLIARDTEFDNNFAREYSGGCIYALNGATVELHDSSLTNHASTASGFGEFSGVIHANGSAVSITVSGCRFEDNSVAAIVGERFENDFSVTDSVFLNNSGWSAQVWPLQGTLTVRRCRFINNTNTSSNSTNQIDAIDASGSFVHNAPVAAEITDSLFLFMDRAIEGSDVSANPTRITNATFHGVDVAIDGGVATLANSIMTGSPGGQPPLRGTNISTRYVLTDKGPVFDATSQIIPGLDPYLQTPDAATLDPGNTRLAPGSIAIDAGDSTLLTTTTDLGGNPRPIDDPDTPDAGVGSPAVDIGAFEFQTDTCPPDVNLDGVLDNGDIQAFVALFVASDIEAEFNRIVFE